jgi:hypothetical protein
MEQFEILVDIKSDDGHRAALGTYLTSRRCIEVREKSQV